MNTARLIKYAVFILFFYVFLVLWLLFIKSDFRNSVEIGVLKKRYFMIWDRAPWILEKENDIFKRNLCEFKNCYALVNLNISKRVTKRRIRLFKQLHALVVVGNQYQLQPKQLLGYRRHASSSDIRYIYAVQESPKAFRNFFHYSMTHRTTSEIYFPYAYILPKNPENQSHWTLPGRKGSNTAWLPFDPSSQRFTSQIVLNKTKDILWTVSHCTTFSKREDYVELFKNATRLKIDQFGACNNETLEKNVTWADFLQDYRFVLAFENNLCQDYITEKFFRCLGSLVVPVVRGAPKSNYLRVAPPHSFIHVDDFRTMGHLGNYLEYLSTNQTAYQEYFWWMEHYQMVEDYAELPERLNPFCNFCRALNTKTPNETYANFNKFWEKEAHCAEDRDVEREMERMALNNYGM